MKKIFTPKFTIAVVISLIMIYVINFTMVLMPTVEYVRLKSGKEFKNVKVAKRGDNYEIDGKLYFVSQIDSMSSVITNLERVK